MHPPFSRFGKRLGHTGIQELMDDLGRAMCGEGVQYMLGGGNPAAVPGMQAMWRERMQELLEEPARFDAMLGNYDTPQGRPAFIDALAGYFSSHYGWKIDRGNIAVINGSQSGFFALLNMLAGVMPDGSRRKILLPLMPEYIGYADQGIEDGLFAAFRPSIQHIGDHTFKYHVDFSTFELADDIAAILVSRPTNPTGNVLTDKEVDHLSLMAKSRGIPLIIDNAYGAPFPHIIFTEVSLKWEEHIILSFSLSKLGLPGTRTGIVIAAPEIISNLSAMNAVISLANTNIGQEITAPLIASGKLVEACSKFVTPFYEEKRKLALQWVNEFFDDSLPWKLHVCEGSLFFWLWCEDAAISSKEFYERLKKRGVLVVPGHYFFFGLQEPWEHSRECIRINYSQSGTTVREGLKIIGEELYGVFGRK